MICNHCGAELTDGSSFCTQCGNPVSLDGQTGKIERILVEDGPDEAPYGSDGLDVIACPACGERNNIADVACVNCGAPLERESYFTGQETQAMPVVEPISASPRHAAEPADRPNRGTGRVSRHTAERQARIAAGEPPYRDVESQPSLTVYPEEKKKPIGVIVLVILLIIAIVAGVFAIAKPFGSSDQDSNNANVININTSATNTNANANTNSNVNAAAINNAVNTNAANTNAASNTNAAATNTNTNAASNTNTSASTAATQESSNSGSSSSASSGSNSGSSSSASSSSNSGSVRVSLQAANGSTLSGTVHRDANGYVLADSSTHKYSMSELKSLGLSPAEMCIAWNEPYARAGYHFSNAGLRDYFNSTDWYVDSGSKPELTGTPVENAKTIRELAENSGASEWKYLALR